MNPNLKLLRSDCIVDQQSLEEKSLYGTNKFIDFGFLEKGASIYFSNTDYKFHYTNQGKETEIYFESQHPLIILAGGDLFEIYKKSLLKINMSEKPTQIIEGIGLNTVVIGSNGDILYIEADEISCLIKRGNIYKKERIKFDLFIKKRLLSLDLRENILAVGTEDGLIILSEKSDSEFKVISVFKVDGSADYIRLGSDFLYVGCFLQQKSWQWLSNPGRVQFGLIPDREIEVKLDNRLQGIFTTRHFFYYINDNQINEIDLISEDAQKLNRDLNLNLFDINQLKGLAKKQKLSIHEFENAVKYLQTKIGSFEISDTKPSIEIDVLIEIEKLKNILDDELFRINPLFVRLSKSFNLFGTNNPGAKSFNSKKFLENIKIDKKFPENLVVSEKSKKHLLVKYNGRYGGNMGICIELGDVIPSQYSFCILLNPKVLIQELPDELREFLRILSNITSFNQASGIFIRSIMTECRDFIGNPDLSLNAYSENTGSILRRAIMNTWN